MKRGEKYPHSDLTEVLIGNAFNIYKQIGFGYPEKIYQKAYENRLIDQKLSYCRENYCKVEVDGKKVGSFRPDFLVEDAVVVELKIRDFISSKDISQVLTYLRVKDKKVGLILLFTKRKVIPKRLIL